MDLGCAPQGAWDMVKELRLAGLMHNPVLPSEEVSGDPRQAAGLGPSPPAGSAPGSPDLNAGATSAGGSAQAKLA